MSWPVGRDDGGPYKFALARRRIDPERILLVFSRE